MPYEKVQFIGHAINTGCRGPDAKGRWEYVGVPEPERDVAARLELVKRALASARPAAEGDAKVLKVFVLPEFFFRGLVGAYRLGSPEVDKLVSGLQELVKGGEWKDWLFVFGTALGWSALTQEDIEKRLAEEEQVAAKKGATFQKDARRRELEAFTIDNFSLCQAGGFLDAKAGPAAAHVVVKEHMSGIDFVTDKPPGNDWFAGRYGLLLERVRHATSAPAGGSEVQRRPYDGAGIFTHHGIWWAVEVCLDHLAGRLKASKPDKDVRIQVVPSCGASIQANAVVVKNGYVFNCDGLSGGGVAVPKGNAHTQLAAVAQGALRPVTDVTRVALSAADLAGARVADLFADGPGELHVYKPLPL